MGIRDGAAQGMMDRLKTVGVPSVIGYLLGQCAYIPARNRHQNIPEPIVGKSEITWLVDQYQQQLQADLEPMARVSLVRELCFKVFGSSAPGIFDAAYPELAGSEMFEEVAEPSEQELIAHIDEIALQLAWRYFTGHYDPTSPATAQTAGTLEQGDHTLSGYIVIIEGYICFLEPSDMAVEDPRDGDPLILRISDLSSCSVGRPSALVTDTYGCIDVYRSTDGRVQLDASTKEGRLRFRIPYDGRDREDQEKVERNVRKLLYVLDNELMRHEYGQLKPIGL